MHTYYAVVGQRVMRIQGRNVWEAAERAAVHFGSRWLEGLQFFRGEAGLAMWRTGMDAPVFAADREGWLKAFRAQGRSLVRWERCIGRAIQ
jgi:hypothetical protein